MTPLVSVIIPHHLDENHEYLKLCVDSVLASEGVDFELLVVADTVNPPDMVITDPRMNLIWDRSLNLVSKKLNWAATQARGKYLWLISDDVMVSKSSMRVMVDGMGENQIICNPMSNSDNGSQFWGDVGFPVKLSREELLSMNSGTDLVAWYEGYRSEGTRLTVPFLIPVRHFVAFYCTMIPKTVWEQVGELDDRMDFRHNDQDYCIRAAQLGIPSMINLGAFALHFGDKTLPKVTTPEQLNECTRVFQEKYATRT